MIDIDILQLKKIFLSWLKRKDRKIPIIELFAKLEVL